MRNSKIEPVNPGKYPDQRGIFTYIGLTKLEYTAIHLASAKTAAGIAHLPGDIVNEAEKLLEELDRRQVEIFEKDAHN
jgi:hypothetical protein